jgi:hypothetical protein
MEDELAVPEWIVIALLVSFVALAVARGEMDVHETPPKSTTMFVDPTASPCLDLVADASSASSGRPRLERPLHLGELGLALNVEHGWHMLGT